MSELVKQLKAAQRKIDSPEKWTKGAFFRAANNRRIRLSECTPDTDIAKCCLLGATILAADCKHNDLAETYLAQEFDTPGMGVAAFNDKRSTTWLQVQMLLDFAILMAKDDEREDARLKMRRGL